MANLNDDWHRQISIRHMVAAVAVDFATTWPVCIPQIMNNSKPTAHNMYTH